MNTDYGEFFDRQTDPKFTKKVSVSGKQDFTNIDTYYIVGELTKQFGLMGTGFGLAGLNYRELTIGDTILLILQADFWYKKDDKATSFPITNSIKLSYKTKNGYLMVDEDAFKKIETNTLAKAASKIGFGTDVYLGLFEDGAYMTELMYDAVQSVQPTDVSKLLKGINYYKADKELILKHFMISHLKDLPLAKMEEAEALIKKLSTKEVKNED